MSNICLTCVKNYAAKTASSSSLKARAVVSYSINMSKPLDPYNMGGNSNIRPKNTFQLTTPIKLSGDSKLKCKANMSCNLRSLQRSGEGFIKSYLKVQHNAITKLRGVNKINHPTVDKFAGHISHINALSNFQSSEKLYPIGDITTSYNNSYFVDKQSNANNLFANIDEGVFTGNLTKNGQISYIISDDKITYIQPSSIFTNGDFRYKCEVTSPMCGMKESFLFIRASAPMSNYSSDIPPEYKIQNIKLEDPSGNLIVKYKDIILRGDADYTTNYVNFATYISEPEINNLLLRSWEPDYPIMGEGSGYTLNLDFNIRCLDDPFSEAFSRGYEDTCKLDFVNNSNNDYLSFATSPLSTQSHNFSLNPTNSLRISAIEICNSGDIGVSRDTYLRFFSEVADKGQRLTRNILPIEVLINSNNLDIYPQCNTTWISSVDDFNNYGDNTTVSGAQILTAKLQDDAPYNYITLLSTDPIDDSGRLTVKFSHQTPRQIRSYSDGAFTFGGISKDFDTSEWQTFSETDNFFTIDSLELRVVAKKAVGTRNYTLDVVGYSDDGILNITPKIGAFLQNSDIGSGTIPTVSGFKHIDDLGFSTESISSKDQYFEANLTSNSAGDHYRLASTPSITGTTFQEYNIPLTIYKDNVELGQSIDYSMSSYFENLYFDIYPLPSGASISTLQLVIHYKPSNGLMLHTIGQQANVELARRSLTLLPQNTQTNTSFINTSGTQLSSIANIPQAYKYTDGVKSNYGRRWFGVDGNISNGPFDTNMFDFAFYAPQINHPFIFGYYNFNNLDDATYPTTIYRNNSAIENIPFDSSTNLTVDGTGLVRTIVNNNGLRFNSDSLFAALTTPHKTIDWTSIAGYEQDPLYGKISDSYNNVVRLHGGEVYLTATQLSDSGGFSAYIKFSPDIDMSGINYNLFNSGVLMCRWQNNSDRGLEWALAYKNGHLSAYAQDTNNNIINITDPTPYDEYQYPLSVLLTYNDHDSRKLKLYTDNELVNNFDILRVASNAFNMIGATAQTLGSTLQIGRCAGSGVGMNMFVSDIGITTEYCNIVTSGANKLLKETTAQSFFDGIRMPYYVASGDNNRLSLSTYINEPTSSWHLGAFKVCAFSADFDYLTKRVGQNYITHHLKHSGSGYGQLTDISLPVNVNASGLSYHSQIENDFLRFNLSDTLNNFYSADPRLSKDLPRGYNFQEHAISVETIIQHETLNNIEWQDGTIGPKLIISLYTKNQDPVDRPSKVNWGLINRSIHYLKPSGCWETLNSTFNYNDLLDTSEPWADFDIDTIKTEFDHKYYSNDIDDMFLQYDLAYPSGNSFDSIIKIHSANVKLTNALIKASNYQDTFNLIASGDQTPISQMNFYTTALDIHYTSQNLFTSGDYVPATSSIMSFQVSGATLSNSSINLYVLNSNSEIQSMPLYVGGRYPQFDDQVIFFSTYNTLADQTQTSSVNLSICNIATTGNSNGLVNLFVSSVPVRFSPLVSESFSLSISGYQYFNPIINSSCTLYINSESVILKDSASCNLFTMNYPAFNESVNQQTTITWNSNNVGVNIATSDNDYAFLEANDEIRGVDLACYGTCQGMNSCTEDQAVAHDITWSTPIACVDGGIFRAKNTYTNLEASGFKTDVGYNGHFYGIRKYVGLIPNAPYNIIVAGRTGSTDMIELPIECMEIEYGTNDYVAYSGVKLSPDDSRQAGDKYGKSVATKHNLMAIGAPLHSLQYSEYNSNILETFTLNEAGAVYVYRRDDRPTGTWPVDEDKSPWVLETKLTLPSGLLKDYYTTTYKSSIGNIPLELPVAERHWRVGQEGRQFGHSLDVAINKSGEKSFGETDRQIIAVGGPSAKWTGRTFEELTTSGVQIGLLVFTDEFKPTIFSSRYAPPYSYQTIVDAVQNKDLIFQYFSNPPVRFDVKVIIYEPVSDNSTRIIEDFPEPKPSFITKARISRNQGLVNSTQNAKILQDMKDVFHTTFPYDVTKLNNNIPAIIGVYVDNSRSLGTKALNPALQNFIAYYQQYSFASGLMDFYGVRSSGVVVSQVSSLENWITASTFLLDQVLDTGRLLINDQIRFFTSGIGSDAFNSNLSQFNYPPDSGGKVFIFEKESGNWNLIQELKASTITYGLPDRFGHAVAISDNTEVIAVGSPYISEACKIYEYKPLEKQRLYQNLSTWLSYKSSTTGGVGRYSTLLNSFNRWVTAYGNVNAQQMLYANLTSTEKFEARVHLNIKEYQNIYTSEPFGFTADDWGFIPAHFAPIARLGYSVAVNEDGNTVAFGAPTDSFNQWDDGRIYYKNAGYNNPVEPSINIAYPTPIQPSWRSNVNAGAVRLFESRKYYPHNTVVEYGKFGNKQKSLGNPLDSGNFNVLSTVFADKSFRTTEFTEVKIPENAGLAFIITPEVDALSDEIINNIIEWLSLGDRNLVLVGNDPVWEDNGAYATSNDIINQILQAVDSRMKIVAARNSYEALSSSSSCANLGAIPSFVPSNSLQTYVQPLLVPANGVGDIRLNFENIPQWKPLNEHMPCPPLVGGLPDPSERLNSKCQLPLVNGGDLRAEWIASCLRCDFKTMYYSVNTPYLFKSYTPVPCCDLEDIALADNRIDLAGQEPVPLLVAATNITETNIIPAAPATSGLRPVYQDRLIRKSTIVTTFSENNIGNEPAMLWDSGNNNYTNLAYNINQSTSTGLFIQPPLSLFNNRQSLLQATAIPQQEIVIDSIIVSPISPYCVEENVGTSKIIGIAGLSSETDSALYRGSSDSNLNFYLNLVAKTTTRDGESNIAQLGGWTGRASFKDAINTSILLEVFKNGQNEVRQNASKPYPTDDVCWISNPLNLPSNDELIEIKNWLNLGNKKLIITHDDTIVQAQLVDQLYALLNSNIKLLYLTGKDEYARPFIFDFLFNTAHPVSTGYDVNSSISAFLTPVSQYIIPFVINDDFITTICYADKGGEIRDITFNTNGYWKLDSGITKVTFPAIAGSGYKFFINTVSETPSENQSIKMCVSNISTASAALPFPSERFIAEAPLGNTTVPDIDTAFLTTFSTTSSLTFNAQVISGVNSIDFYFASYEPRLQTITTAYIPKTTRLLSISGVAISIINTVLPQDYTISEVIGLEPIRISEPRPEQTIVTTRFAPISNINDQYCDGVTCSTYGLNNQYINDGPVVAAQEVEHISSFSVGFNRSRITLLADSTFVQGRCIANETNSVSANTVQFLRSLYPVTDFSTTNSGRHFISLNKIVSPERGSPQKYLSILNNSGVNIKFNNGSPVPASMDKFGSSESQYDPRYVLLSTPPWTQDDDEVARWQKKTNQMGIFRNNQYQYGATSKFTSIINGKLYSDQSIGSGGMPELMKDTGYDYLDLEQFPSGYPGDLFGYSVALHNNKLVVGSPFSAFSQESVQPWSYYMSGGFISGIQLSYNGGAGAAYVFEKTFKGSGLHGVLLPWEFTQKLRPSSINVSQDLDNSTTSQTTLGNNGYTNQYLAENSTVGDQFGHDVDIASDMIIVGAPGHDFANLSINGTGEFIRKSFNSEFNIPSRTTFDLGSSGSRAALPNSGTVVLNNGAIFTFENKVVDWSTKQKKWVYIEKIVPQGIMARSSGNENDNFATAVAISRNYRSDSDYTIVGGATRNSYSSSGTDIALNAGASYTHDIMLRKPPPVSPLPETYIDATIFGERDGSGIPTVHMRITNNNQNNAVSYTNGIVYSNRDGNIFMEVSGQDLSTKGFIGHRPFIQSIDGQYAYGKPDNNSFNLFIKGKQEKEAPMNMFVDVSNSAFVYNNIGLYNGAILDFASSIPSGLSLYVDCPEPISISGGLFLCTSGIGNYTDTLNMRIRGK